MYAVHVKVLYLLLFQLDKEISGTVARDKVEFVFATQCHH